MIDARPLAIDLFCGLGGWTEGLLAEGYRVVGYDIEAHAYGDERYPAELVLADVLELDGAAFAEAALIVASPPCQEYSYMAMPWSRAKAKAAAIRADPTGAEMERLNRLFNACFRIQREASQAAGRQVPLVVENVRGAIPWVGRSRWNFGSFHLWGDVPALMPAPIKATKVPGFRFDGRSQCFRQAAADGVKNGGGGSWFGVDPRGNVVEPGNPARGPAIGEGVKARDLDGYERNHPRAFGWKAPRTSSGNPGRKAKSEGQKVSGISHIRSGAPHTKHLTNPAEHRPQEGRKNGGDWFGSGESCSAQRRASSNSTSRKAASARIAKIPLTLSRYIAAHYHPRRTK